MLELRDIGARNVHQWLVTVDNTFRDKVSHAKVIVLDSEMLKIAF